MCVGVADLILVINNFMKDVRQRNGCIGFVDYCSRNYLSLQIIQAIVFGELRAGELGCESCPLLKFKMTDCLFIVTRWD